MSGKKAPVALPIHIVPDSSAAFFLNEAMRKSGRIDFKDDLLVNLDDLARGPLPAFHSLSSWRKERDAYWSQVDNTGYWIDESSWSSSTSWNLLAQMERLRAATSITLWVAGGASDQIFLTWLIQLLQRIDVDPYALKIIQMEGAVQPSCLSKDRLLAHPEPFSPSKQAVKELGRAWEAIASPDPEPLLDFIAQPSKEFLYLRPALCALLDRYPDRKSGLSRVDLALLRQTRKENRRERLQGDSRAARVINETFGWNASSLDWWEDTWLLRRLEHLGDLSLPQPALTLSVAPGLRFHARERLESGRTDMPTMAPGERRYLESAAQSESMRSYEIALTEFGAAICAGTANFIERNGIDDWVLNVHLDSAKGRVWRRSRGKRLLGRAL